LSTVLKRNFFNAFAPEVASHLLGKYLCCGRRCFKITEVEAYDGFSDRASHARSGKTMRNQIMFGEAGRWYVYLTYGMHWMLNIVTGPKNYPSAVLIRGIDGFNGPAKLTKQLSIDKKVNGRFADKKTGLWIEDRGLKINFKKIKKSPRVGVDYAGTYWARRHWRFYI
jgi:DNA-3-methyladenine glycosylase